VEWVATVVSDFECILRKLTVGDDRYIESILVPDEGREEAAGIDPRALALVRLGALIAVGGAPPSYMSIVDEALAAGATVGEAVGTLIAVMPVVGSARVVTAAPKLGLALGYDVNAALEELGD
jgi:4-carboxymuconolactone decarboxylase